MSTTVQNHSTDHITAQTSKDVGAQSTGDQSNLNINLLKGLMPDGRKLTVNLTGEESLQIVKELKKIEDRDERQETALGVQQALITNSIETDAQAVQEHVEAQRKRSKPSDFNYISEPKLEHSVDDDDSTIEGKARETYVWLFNAQQHRSALASLQMCRVVYEASRALREHDFDEFCANIGYKPMSSSIRKFLVIGKVYPRLIQYADQLPASWTSIYALTQMPADDFERCIESGYRLCDLTSSEIDDLVKKTRCVKNLMSPFKVDRKQQSICVANVFFTKKMDDTDLRLLIKALDEVALRLPVKLVIKDEVLRLFKARAMQRYETLKTEDIDAGVRPETWDYGSAANEVHPNPKAA